jgi:hypothetical protein
VWLLESEYSMLYRSFLQDAMYMYQMYLLLYNVSFARSRTTSTDPQAWLSKHVDAHERLY